MMVRGGESPVLVSLFSRVAAINVASAPSAIRAAAITIRRMRTFPAARIARSARGPRREPPCSSAWPLRPNHPNRYDLKTRGNRGCEIGSAGELRLKNARRFLRKGDTKGFRQWNLGNLAISANFGGIHYDDITEAL
jgi:hypothetical protein